MVNRTILFCRSVTLKRRFIIIKLYLWLFLKTANQKLLENVKNKNGVRYKKKSVPTFCRVSFDVQILFLSEHNYYSSSGESIRETQFYSN